MRSKDVTNQVYTTLRKEILNLAIVPGESLREQSLCDRFDASRTPVRSALERLSEENLVQFVPYKGAQATLLHFSDIYQLILMRIVLESKVVVDFARQADPFAQELCKHTLRNQQILLQSPQFEAAYFYALDAELHQIWFNETKVPLIWQVIQEAEVNYTRFRMLDIVRIHNFQEIVDEHACLLKAIAQRDETLIAELVQYHLFGGMRRMRQVLLTDSAGYFADAGSIKEYLDHIETIAKPLCLAT
ncbi:MAG: GntR family transcriptional regulator [Sphaerochaeta sp.]|nr:GntR family transcriptional regulator [Sphaerochaeta sp.]